MTGFSVSWRRWPGCWVFVFALATSLSLASPPRVAAQTPGATASELKEGGVVALPPGLSGSSEAEPAPDALGDLSGEEEGVSVPGTDASSLATAPEGVDLPTLFGEAVVHYQEARYAQAVEAFERFLQLGPDNASAHYNLGNALLRNGELGRAIASYRRARARAPRDEDIRANLQFARTSARDALEVPDAGPVVRTLAFWHFSFSTVERTWLAVVGSVFFWLGLAVARVEKQRGGSRAGLTVAAVAGLLLVATAGSLAVERWHGERVAVVLPAEVDAHAAPRAEAVVRFKLHAGSEVRLTGENPGWVLIELPDGERGWLEERFVERSV